MGVAGACGYASAGEVLLREAQGGIYRNGDGNRTARFSIKYAGSRREKSKNTKIFLLLLLQRLSSKFITQNNVFFDTNTQVGLIIETYVFFRLLLLYEVIENGI